MRLLAITPKDGHVLARREGSSKTTAVTAIPTSGIRPLTGIPAPIGSRVGGGSGRRFPIFVALRGKDKVASLVALCLRRTKKGSRKAAKVLATWGLHEADWHVGIQKGILASIARTILEAVLASP